MVRPSLAKTLGLSIWVLVFCHALGAARSEFTHDRKRVGPLETGNHACLEKFEVSERTIIRTKDSLMLGAKFLNESDVGNREDCFTFCCATHLCNVAVFEERDKDSCYLFDCGPPGGFLCKFTEHSAYTSGVLRVNRHQLDMELWSEQNRHEADLANLRSPGEIGGGTGGGGGGGAPLPPPGPLPPTTPAPAAPTPPPPRASIIPPTSATTPAATPATTPTTAKSTLPPRKCSRWQFECHSGECIAIYNACDGIPQCQDSSDEDPKLGCPAVPTDSSPGSRRLGDLAPGEEGAQAGGSGVGGHSHGGDGGSGPWDKQQQPTRELNQAYDGRIFRNRPTILENYGSYQPQGGHLDDSSVYAGRGRPPSYYDPSNPRPAWPAAPSYNNGEGGTRSGEYLGPDPHPPPPPQQGPYNHYPEYSGPPQVPPQVQQQPQPPPQHYPQPFIQNQHQQLHQKAVWMDNNNSNNNNNNYNPQHQPPPPQNPQQLHQQMQDLHHNHNLPQQQQQQQQERPFIQQQQQQQQQSNGNQQTGGQNTELGMMGGGGVHTPAANNAPPAPSVSAPLPASPATPAAGVSGKNSSNNSLNSTTSGGVTSGAGGAQKSVEDPRHPLKTVAHASLARLEVNLEELEVEGREQDAQASGAILALAMGVCITALLVVLVGCRLRGVRRRLRRHRGTRSPYAHDADYLVNGMYL